MRPGSKCRRRDTYVNSEAEQKLRDLVGLLRMSQVEDFDRESHHEPELRTGEWWKIRIDQGGSSSSAAGRDNSVWPAGKDTTYLHAVLFDGSDPET